MQATHSPIPDSSTSPRTAIEPSASLEHPDAGEFPSIEPPSAAVAVDLAERVAMALTASARAATLGQRWFGLELAAAGSGRPNLAQAFGRWLAFLAAALPLGAGLLLALGPDRRPFQDRICDSRVAVRSGGAAAGSA